jgi:hypothetical protein
LILLGLWLSVGFDSVFDMNMQASGPGGSPVLDALGAAAAAVAGAQDAAVYALADADLEAAIEQTQALAARVFDATLTLVREADERDLGRRSGGSSSAAWLSGRFRIRPGQARTLVRLANHTGPDDGPIDYSANVRSAPTGRELRETGKALAAGAISPEHVMVVSKIMERVPQAVSVDEARQAEAELAGFCGQHDPGTVATLGDYLLALMAADTLDDAENERHRRRELRLNEATGGISGCLTSEGMAMLRTALDPLAAPHPADDGERDPRTPGQRLVDALVELARRAIAANGYETNHGISHRVLVTIGLNTLTAEHPHPSDGSPSGTGEDTSHGSADRYRSGGDESGGTATGHLTGNTTGSESGGVTGRTLGGDGAALPTFTGGSSPAPGEIQWGGLISPATARRIACCAGIQRVVLDPNGAVLDVGREYRTATPAQFAALTARDGGCVFPGCTRPSAWCIAHHIAHWADGGPTDLDNLALLCGHHHTVVHHHGWDVRLGPDRLPDFYPPPWVDPDREPRRNTRPRYGLATVDPDR